MKDEARRKREQKAYQRSTLMKDKAKRSARIPKVRVDERADGSSAKKT